MSRKVFVRVILAVVIVCAVLTVAHAIYVMYAYEHSSIIYFISKEIW